MGLTDTITLTIKVENTYELYEDETYEKVVTLPSPKYHTHLDDWAYEYVHEHTGSQQPGGKPNGNSWYDVTVLASSDPTLVPVGTTFEFGY